MVHLSLFSTPLLVYISIFVPICFCNLPDGDKSQVTRRQRRGGIERDNIPPDALSLSPVLGPADSSITDGQALVDRWLGRRSSCNVGYYLCSSMFNSNMFTLAPKLTLFLGGTVCCLSGYCCTASDICIKDAGGGCCAGGTCALGYGCCAGLGCYPLDGQCCSTGLWCTSGNNCVLMNGVQRCCTDTSCTAYVSNGVTMTIAPSSTSSYIPITTPSPTPPTTTSPLPTPTSTPAAENSPSTTPTQPEPSSTSSGLSESDKIALGCGIGVGLPGTIATIWVCLRRRNP